MCLFQKCLNNLSQELQIPEIDYTIILSRYN